MKKEVLKCECGAQLTKVNDSYFCERCLRRFKLKLNLVESPHGCGCGGFLVGLEEVKEEGVK
jgi:hypothetical protein